jgi:hypothetical protein
MRPPQADGFALYVPVKEEECRRLETQKQLGAKTAGFQPTSRC